VLEGDAPELLLVAAALLYASAQGPVAEVFAVGENSYSVVTFASTGTDPSLTPGDSPLYLTGGGAGITAASLPTIGTVGTGTVGTGMVETGAVEVGIVEVGTLSASGAIAPAGAGVLRTTTAMAFAAPGFAASTVAGKAATVSLTELKSLRKAPLLRQLGLLPEKTIASYLKSNPDVVTGLLAAPPSAVEVSGWWSSLDPAATAAMENAAPQLVGNLDGIPVEVRDDANRVWLTQSIAERDASTARPGSRTLEAAAERELHMLGEVEVALGNAQSVPSRSLLTVDPVGQGRAAIVLGDLATADYVTYLVPGMFFTIDGQINDWTDDAARIYDEQVSWLNLISETDPGEATKTVAVVAWMGYETPNLTNIASLDLAEKGRDALAATIQGLLSERGFDTPYISIIAHSYGTTTALMALTDYDFSIDALALVGSPGSAAQSVDELHVRDGNVFVGEAAWDPVPNTAFFGSDPGSASYGAHQMNVGGGVDLITNEVLAASIGHNGYFGVGSESVRNLALIGIGHGELVTEGSADDKEKTLALLQH
jgi:hypothetical protein